MKHIGIDGTPAGKFIGLGRDHVLSFVKGDLQIFVRGTEQPPRVKPAPILRRDPGFRTLSFLDVFLERYFFSRD